MYILQDVCCELGRGLNVDTSLAGNAGMLKRKQDQTQKVSCK